MAAIRRIISPPRQPDYFALSFCDPAESQMVLGCLMENLSGALRHIGAAARLPVLACGGAVRAYLKNLLRFSGDVRFYGYGIFGARPRRLKRARRANWRGR